MIHITKIHPLFTTVITTADKFEDDMTNRGVIISKKGEIKEWQKVIAVGSSVRDINVGDMVMINFANYVVRKYSKDSIQNDMDNNPRIKLSLNFVDIDDENGNPKECLLLTDRDILYTFEGEERPDTTVPLTKNFIL